MNLIHRIFLASIFLLFSCSSEDSDENACIDESKISYDYQCIIENVDYQPVCGCNGVFYEDVCFAENAGVVEWTEGECN